MMSCVVSSPFSGGCSVVLSIPFMVFVGVF